MLFPDTVKLQRGFHIDVDEKRLAKKHRDRPKEFEDYKIEWNVEGCMEPEVFKFV